MCGGLAEIFGDLYGGKDRLLELEPGMECGMHISRNSFTVRNSGQKKAHLVKQLDFSRD